MQSMHRKISILGAGSWGTALAAVLNKNGHDVTIWSILPEEIEMLKNNHENKSKLQGVVLSEKIHFTSDLEESIKGKDILVFAVPSVYVRSTAKMAAPFITSGQIIVDVAKGIEEDTLLTMSEVIKAEIPKADIAVLSGPSHAEEVGREIPTTVVVGAKTFDTAKYIQDAFMNDTFRVYTSPDMIGIEVGGSLKNVIALAAGISDGLGFGDNTKAALMTRGIAEITRLGVAVGGCLETFAGLSGMGDLIVTCTSRHSRNRKAGYLIGKGSTMQQAMDEVKMVVEGVYSAKAALALAKKYEISMPIVEQINAVLFEGKAAKETVIDLLSRSKKTEHEVLDWE